MEDLILKNFKKKWNNKKEMNRINRRNNRKKEILKTTKI